MKKYFAITFLFFCQTAFADEFSQSVMNVLTAEPVNQDGLQSSSRLALETTLDDNYKSQDRRNEFLDSGFRARFNNQLNFGKGISLNTNILADRFDNGDQIARRNSSIQGGGDRSFENIGIALRELNIAKNSEKYAVILGKFNLNFGSAWLWNRGIWIQQIANDNYRQVEKLGAVAIYRAGDAKKTGQYNFSFSSFTNDRKNFDNSLLNNRDSNKKSDAKAGDVRAPASYAAMLDINFDFGEREKLSYQFSYLNLAVNERATTIASNKVDDQKNFALNMNYQYPLNEKIALDALIEYVEVKNLNGNSDIGERYFTANLITNFGENWNILLGNSRRQNIQINAYGFDQNLSEISLGYEFKKNDFFDRLTIQAGYKNFRNDLKTTVDSQNSIGLLMRYYKNF